MRLIMPRIEAAFTVAALLAFSSAVYADDGASVARISEEGGITISDARIEQPAAEGEDVAVVMGIGNDGYRAAKLVVVDSPAAGRTTLHRTVGTGDSATMQPIPSIDVPGGGAAIELNSTGQHIMLIGLKRSLESGDEVRLSMSFFPGPTLDVRVRVDGAEGNPDRDRSEQETSALSAPSGSD